MKIIPTAFLAASAAVFLAFPHCSAADVRPEEVPVAWYSIEPDHTDDGDRILRLLLEHGIRAVALVSDSVTVIVAARDAELARGAVALAVRNEKLRVTLLPMQATRKSNSQ